MITEACQAVVGHLRQRGLVPYLTATHDREEPASGRGVMQKLGMAYCYSYQEQWQPKGFPVVFRLRTSSTWMGGATGSTGAVGTPSYAILKREL